MTATTLNAQALGENPSQGFMDTNVGGWAAPSSLAPTTSPRPVVRPTGTAWMSSQGYVSGFGVNTTSTPSGPIRLSPDGNDGYRSVIYILNCRDWDGC